jgi:hypothetical protein
VRARGVPADAGLGAPGVGRGGIGSPASSQLFFEDFFEPPPEEDLLADFLAPPLFASPLPAPFFALFLPALSPLEEADFFSPPDFLRATAAIPAAAAATPATAAAAEARTVFLLGVFLAPPLFLDALEEEDVEGDEVEVELEAVEAGVAADVASDPLPVPADPVDPVDPFLPVVAIRAPF